MVPMNDVLRGMDCQNKKFRLKVVFIFASVFKVILLLNSKWNITVFQSLGTRVHPLSLLLTKPPTHSCTQTHKLSLSLPKLLRHDGSVIYQTSSFCFNKKLKFGVCADFSMALKVHLINCSGNYFLQCMFMATWAQIYGYMVQLCPTIYL